MKFRNCLLSVLSIAATTLVVAQVGQPTDARQRLVAGNHNSLDPYNVQKISVRPERGQLAKGQAPFATILSCSDSLVPPEIIFDQGPGELFIIRVAGNVADPATLGSVEYAVAVLKSPYVVVMGHSQCGAVGAAMSPKSYLDKLSSNLRHLVDRIDIGKPAAGDSAHKLKAACIANIRAQVAAIQRDPDIRAAKPKIVGAYFDIATGKVDLLD
ncbi:MAG: carbonic anhydrase [Fimbriimonas sp.]